MDRAELSDWGGALDDPAFARALAALGALAALAPRRQAAAYVPGSGWVVSALAELLATAFDAGAGQLTWCSPLMRDHGQVVPRLRVALPGRARPVTVEAPQPHVLAAIWSELEHASGPGKRLPSLRLRIEHRGGLMRPVFKEWLRPYVGPSADRPPVAASMARPPKPMPPDLPERAGAEPPRAGAQMSPAASGAALESLPQRPAPTVPRYVHADSRWADDPLAPCLAYVVGRPVEVAVDIDARRLDSTAASVPFPEDRLPAAEQHELQVMLHEPRQFHRPMLATIVLPRTGRSTRALFRFTPRVAGNFEARLSVLHRGRVLQTLLLRTQVLTETAMAPANGPGITLDEETRVRHDWSDLASRRAFDLAVVFNHTATDEPLATAVYGPHAWATSLEGIAAPLQEINRLISNVALSVADYGDGLDQGENPALLVRLAQWGAELYSLLYRDQLQPLSSDGFDVGAESVTCIQLVSTRGDAVVPLEFMYDYNVPDPGAPVCPQHRQALEQGCCPDGCARRSAPRGYVCPMGFWGLKKVIERHLYDARRQPPPGVPLLVQAEAVQGRNRLDLTAGALVGYSREVKPSQVKSLLARLKRQYGRAVPVARDWEDWSEQVQSAHPALLIAFPHNEGQKIHVLLEIGGAKLYTSGLESRYVRGPDGAPPLVFLLGCDVAGAAQDFAGHIRYFRQAGAAVVVSTIATVFGAHAVRVGEAIVSGLLAPPAQDGPRLIGELIRDAKRAALLQSLPMALCVVAFGDADWQL